MHTLLVGDRKPSEQLGDMRAQRLLHRWLPLSAGTGTTLVILNRDDLKGQGRRGLPAQCQQQQLVKYGSEASSATPARLLSTKSGSPMSNEAFLSQISFYRSGLVQSTDDIYTCINSESETFESIYDLSAQSLDTTREAAGKPSRVFLAARRDSGLRRAVKVIRKNSEDSQEAEHELTALTQLDHPHIVKLLRYYDEGPYMYLIFELCKGPDLHTRIRSLMEEGAVMSEQEAALALRHMLKALRCCHSLYLGHYDIKPEHFMYKGDDLTCLKMIDLGSCTDFKKTDNSLKGTVDYMAPEISHGIYGPEADVWSCGIVFFTMLTGHHFLPVNAAPAVKRKLIRNAKWVTRRIQWAKEHGNMSTDAYELLRGMLSYDRHLRFDVEQALAHSFLQHQDCPGKLTVDEAQMERAGEVVHKVVECFREFSNAPVLKRTACLLTAHLVGYEEHMLAEQLAFRTLDKASRGKISVQVIEDYLASKGCRIPDDLDEIFSGADVSGDGYISFVEFLSATLPKSVQHDKEICEIVFRILDKNKDGFIDVWDLCNSFTNNNDDAYDVSLQAIKEVGGAKCKKLSFEALYALMCK